MGAREKTIEFARTRCFRCGARTGCAIVPMFQTHVLQASLCAVCLEEALQAAKTPVARVTTGA